MPTKGTKDDTWARLVYVIHKEQVTYNGAPSGYITTAPDKCCLGLEKVSNAEIVAIQKNANKKQEST